MGTLLGLYFGTLAVTKEKEHPTSMTIEEVRKTLGDDYNSISDEELLRIINMLETVCLMLIENKLSER